MLGSVPMIRATMLAGLDELLQAKRINTTTEQLLRELGSRFKPPDDLELNIYLCLLERVAVLTRDPCFGLGMARAFPVGAMKVFSFLAIHAPDLKTMVEIVSQYARLQLDGLSFRFREKGRIATITWEFSPEVTGPTKTMLEFAMALCVDRSRIHSGTDWTPTSARFVYADPRTTLDCRERYADFFGQDIAFDARICSLTAPSSAFERPLKTANKKLFELLLEYADQEMSKRESAITAEHRVAIALLDGLPMQDGNLEAVAKALKRTPRQIQDELKREGTNFEAVLIAVRKRLAKNYLGTSPRSMTEIAMIVGFSELSAFTRAVKSWYGLTPTELRDALKAGKKFD